MSGFGVYVHVPFCSSLCPYCDFAVVVEMDADGSHAPEQLPQLLAELDHADVVIGSRWVEGGTVVNWPRSREILSRGGLIAGPQSGWCVLLLDTSPITAAAGWPGLRYAVTPGQA